MNQVIIEKPEAEQLKPFLDSQLASCFPKSEA